MPLQNPLASALAGTAMDLVDSPNATAQASLKTGLGIGTLANSGGTATLGGILGDVANSSVATRLTTIDGIVDDIKAALYGAVGIASFPAAAAAANDVSLAEVIRYIQESQIGTLANTGGTPTLAAILGDVANESLAYRIMEIERHLHGWERWFGLAGTPDAELHRADRIGTTTTAFQMDGGNNTWGSWLQILGSSDTPADVGNVKFDLHKIMITDCERDASIHLIQIAAGASGAAALTAGTYTEIVYKPQATNTEELPFQILMRRQDAATKMWARVWAVGQNTGTVDFFIGLHEYAA